MKKYMIWLLLAALLTGCGQSSAPPSATEAPAPAEETAVSLPTETLPPPVPVSVVLEPQAPGEREVRCDSAVVDYSNARQGYIMVCHHAETDRRLKVLLKTPAATYQYDLPQGRWIVLPLSGGDGAYQAGIYRNTGGSKYAALMTASFEVVLEDEFAPFLRPNRYVDYLNAPNTTDLGARLCAGLDHPLDKVAAIYGYVVENLAYDEEKAATVQSGYLPVLDEVLAAGKGICFDYAALMTAMLRTQQIPCKLVVGYAGTTYHAWISVWTQETGWLDGILFFDGQSWKRMDPTFAASAQEGDGTMEFIENGDYTEKYLY